VTQTVLQLVAILAGIVGVAAIVVFLFSRGP
jgi:hypothetical protein